MLKYFNSLSSTYNTGIYHVKGLGLHIEEHKVDKMGFLFSRSFKSSERKRLGLYDKL